VTDLPSDDPHGEEGIAADDAGGSVLGLNTGRTAGGQEAFEVGSAGPAGAEHAQGAGDVAADDAGATAAAAERLPRAEHRRD
jgi:hypothetical protein